MRVLKSFDRTVSGTEGIEARGLAGWLLSRLSRLRGEHAAQRRQMHLIETLALGGKRQLMLVECRGERFLVGGGLESVQAIVRVRADAVESEVDQKRDELCR